MATIYDIAALSNTSIATVSYVLNGQGDKRRISKATQEKVLSVAESLNYRPNTSAKRLSMTDPQRTSIALIWPSSNFEQALISFLRAVSEITSLFSEPIEVNIQFYQPGTLENRKDLLASQMYNGIILGGASGTDLNFLSKYQSSSPIVLINRTLTGYPSVSIDHDAAGRLACDLIIQRSCRKISTVWEREFHVATNARRDAFIKMCIEKGAEIVNDQFYCEGNSEAGYSLGLKMVQKKTINEIVFCNHEEIACGLLAAFNEFHIPVGEKVLLLTTNTGPSSLCRFATPSISVIDLKMQTVAQEAIKLCYNLISRRVEAGTQITVQPEIVFRDSFPNV